MKGGPFDGEVHTVALRSLDLWLYTLDTEHAYHRSGFTNNTGKTIFTHAGTRSLLDTPRSSQPHAPLTHPEDPDSFDRFHAQARDAAEQDLRSLGYDEPYDLAPGED